MLLTEHNLFYYLLDKGMVDSQKVVDGEFTVRRNDSRNNNFLVNREYDHHPYFVKQVKAQDAEKTETLRTEAHCYHLANTDARYQSLKNFLPRFFHYDAVNHVLVTEQVKEAISVFDYYFQGFNSKIPEIIADILASYHGTITTFPQQSPSPFFRQQKPWVFSVATTPPAFWPHEGQAASQQMIQLIHKNREYVQLLSQVENEWKPQALIHNDAKFNNFLISYNNEADDVRFIKLIDWELADIGDPLWDVATIFQSYLMLWVSTDAPDQALPPGMKKVTLPQVQPSIAQFWNRYAAQMKWSSGQAGSLLLKATRFCALKLIHACFETTPYSPSLQPMSVKLLQMSLNILRSPQDAAVRLLGITNTYKHEPNVHYA